MRKIGFVLLLLILGLPVIAQHVHSADPLSLLNNAKHDTDKLKALQKVVTYYQYKDSAKAFGYARQGLDLAKKKSLPLYTMIFYKTLGNLNTQKGSYTQAIDYFNLELAIAKQRKDTRNTQLANIDMGITYQQESKFPDAQACFFKALAIAENQKDNSNLCLIYDDIASIYENEGQYAKAKQYTLKALALGEKKDTTAITKAYELMGVIYNDAGRYDSARYYYKLDLHLYQQKKDSIGEATMYMQIGSAYGQTYAEVQQTQQYAIKSKAIWDKMNPGNTYALYNMDNLSLSYWNTAELLDTMHIANKKALKLSLAAKAEQSFTETYKLSAKYSNTIAELFALDKLAKIEAWEGKNAWAYQHMRLYNTVHDSVFSQRNNDKIASLDNQHEIALRDKQIEINKLEVEKKKRTTVLLIISLVSLFIISSLIYLQSRNRKRTNVQLTGLNSQLYNANKINTQFFSILQHDIRRPIADFISLVWLIQDQPEVVGDVTNGTTKKVMNSAEHLLDTMDDLLLWSKGQMENFKPQLRDFPVAALFDYIKDQFAVSNVTMHFELNDPALSLFTDEHYIKTIMLNLTNNAVHALAQTPHPAIEWKAWKEGQVSYLSIADNGPGATEDALKPLYDDTLPVGIKNGLGLHIVRDLAKVIGCKITVDTDRPQGVEIMLMIQSANKV